MQFILLLSMLCFLAACSQQSSDENLSHADIEKPIQHLKLEDITSSTKAVTVFSKEVELIQSKQELTLTELNEIHISTYSLEKAVAYFVENSEGAKKDLAGKIAVMVEKIHLASENNRAGDTKKHVEKLGFLVEEFDL